MTRKLVDSYEGVVIGTPSDDVITFDKFCRLKMVMNPKIIGADQDGLVIEWHYKDVIFTMMRASMEDPVIGTITRYAVQKIEERQ